MFLYSENSIKRGFEVLGPELLESRWLGQTAVDAFVLCFQSGDSLPRCWSRVQVPSPATSFQQLMVLFEARGEAVERG